MSIKKTATGWQVDIQPSRSAPRVRRTFKTKAEAVRFKQTHYHKFSMGGDLKPQKDRRKLSELIETHYQLHGQHLKSGLQRKSKMLNLAKLSGDPEAHQLTPAWYASLRQLRAKTVKANTLNHDRSYLHALFSDLEKAGLWQHGNPISKTRPLKFDKSEVVFLSLEQIHHLLSELQASRNPHVYLIARICLETGTRWSEAEKLQAAQIGQGVLSFWKTKSGKPRHIPVSDQLFSLLKNHKKASFNRLFSSSYAAFTEALERTGIELPRGQRTHVLRHTFASHFVMKGGNLLELQKILGHSTIEMTMRYAHLAPGHLESAKMLNPLAVDTSLTPERND